MAVLLPRHNQIVEPDRVAAAVEDSYQSCGYLVDQLTDAGLLLDPLCQECPIVGVTQGFRDLTGYSQKDVLGRSCRFLYDGVPDIAISRSALRNVKDFCTNCRVQGLAQISQIIGLQPHARKDGSHFMNFFIMGLIVVKGHRYVLHVLVNVGEGLYKQLPKGETARLEEAARAIYKRLGEHLWCNGMICAQEDSGEVCRSSMWRRGVSLPQYIEPQEQPEFGFFSERLQDHCILTNNGYTAIRREPLELPTNSLVFGDRPVEHTEQGLTFSVRVNSVISTFHGLPILGFTKRQPTDTSKLYPCVVRCLGSSVLIGGSGEAFARDQSSNLDLGFRQPPSSEVQVWPSKDARTQSAASTAAAQPAPRSQLQPREGDLLQCLYLRDGRIQLLRNGHLELEFDTGRPVDESSDYYAVVDVCFAAVSVTLVPSQAASSSSSTSTLDSAPESVKEFRRLGSPSSSAGTSEANPHFGAGDLAEDHELAEVTTSASDLTSERNFVWSCSSKVDTGSLEDLANKSTTPANNVDETFLIDDAVDERRRHEERQQRRPPRSTLLQVAALSLAAGAVLLAVPTRRRRHC